MPTLFISDLHLDEHSSAATARFLHLLKTDARTADALYILGDFFEIWLGDDLIAPWCQPICSALRTLTEQGIPVYWMQGNRDFLVGKRFVQAIGARLISDPLLIDLYGERTLLMHGDTLCIDDVRYLRFRRYVRNRAIQQLFLLLPRAIRKHIAERMRAGSQAHQQAADKNILDVNFSAVTKIMNKYRATQLIHGHTHRPSIEHWDFNHSLIKKRFVLSDWHTNGNVLIYTADHCARLMPI